MRFLYFTVAFLLISCGTQSSNSGKSTSSDDTQLTDELSSSNWELTGNGGMLGFYFGPSGEFMRVAYDSANTVQAMGLRGNYVIRADGKVEMIAKEKTCPSFSGPASQTSSYRLQSNTLILGTSGAFEFAKVAKSFEERFGHVVQWGCIDNAGTFNPSPWTPY